MNDTHKGENKPASKKTNSFFSESLQMTGVLTTAGNIRLDGRFEGKIDSDGTVFLGDKACVNGEINCGSIVSSGKIEGRLSAVDEVSLKNPCVFEGEILTSSINIEDQVVFNAGCRLVNPERLKKKPVPLIRRFRKPVNHD